MLFYYNGFWYKNGNSDAIHHKVVKWTTNVFRSNKLIRTTRNEFSSLSLNIRALKPFPDQL
jgi:hypothetical protein